MRLQSFVKVGSVLALALGIAITVSSLQAISESSAGSQFTPALDSFDSQVTLSSQLKPNKGELIGRLEISRLNKVIPIFEGTGSAELKKGAGHYEKSVLPGASDNSVIVGHRDSVFSKFGSLKVGDSLTVTTSYGKFVYKINSFRIVKANDRTVIVPTKDARLTLSTCYPFYFIGNAPKRFIVSASLIS
jgi:sortase A